MEDRTLLSAISGTVFEDVNANGTQEASETGIEGVTVFLDQDNDGQLDSGETSTVTLADGSYELPGLPDGSYTVAQVIAGDSIQTAPTPATGPSLLGEVNRDFASPGTTPIGLTWADGFLYNLNRNDRIVSQLNPVTGAVVSQFTAPGNDPWDLTFDGTDFWAVGQGEIVRFNSLGNELQRFAAPGTFPVGIAWDGSSLWVVDRDSQTIDQVDPTTGTTGASFAAPGSGGNLHGLTFDGQHLWTNRWGSVDKTYELEPSTGELLRSFETPIVRYGQVLAAAFDGEFLWVSLNQDDWILRLDIAQPGSHNITLSGGATVSGQDFGNFRLGTVSGTVFEDLDANGIQGTSEPGLEGWRIYIDQNQDGQFQLFEKTALTDANGDYTIGGLRPNNYSLVEIVRAPGWSPTTASSQTVTIDTSGQNVAGTDVGNLLNGVGPVDPEFRVNTTSTGDQNSTLHAVASDAAGNTVVVWQGNGVGDDSAFSRKGMMPTEHRWGRKPW